MAEWDYSEILFEFSGERDHKFFRCELRDDGQWRAEAQLAATSSSVNGSTICEPTRA